MLPTSSRISAREATSACSLGMSGGAITLTADWPLRYFGSTHTPRRADTYSFVAIHGTDSSLAMSIAELPRPTTITVLPRISTGSNGDTYAWLCRTTPSKEPACSVAHEG